MAKMKRDSKDPAPNANNSFRQPPDGNAPATGETHNSSKAQTVKGSQRFTPRAGGEKQPTRMNGDGNTPVTGEMHNSKKGSTVPASSRF